MPEILDRAHIAEFSGGDTALEKEILTLFQTQASHYLSELANAADQAAFRATAHKLKGAARAVGAARLAALAEEAEKTIFETETVSGRASRISVLDEALKEMSAFIEMLNA